MGFKLKEMLGSIDRNKADIMHFADHQKTALKSKFKTNNLTFAALSREPIDTVSLSLMSFLIIQVFWKKNKEKKKTTTFE